MTVYENLVYFGGLFGVRAGAGFGGDRAWRLLKDLHLSRRKGAFPSRTCE